MGALFHGVGYSSLKESARIARTSALRPQRGVLRTRFTRSEKRARASPDSGPTLLCPGDAVADRYCRVPVMAQAEGVTASDTDMFATIATWTGMGGGGGGGLGPNASSCNSAHRCGPRFMYRIHAHFPQNAHTHPPTLHPRYQTCDTHVRHHLPTAACSNTASPIRSPCYALSLTDDGCVQHGCAEPPYSRQRQTRAWSCLPGSPRRQS